jgi:two-component sensor histidine kinase
LQSLSKSSDFPVKEDRIYTIFREDKSGNMWIGLSQSAVLRYQNGKFQLFSEADGVPKGWIKDILLDQKGRIWIASTIGGVSRIDEPNAEKPKFVNYNKSKGLSSDSVSCLVEDKSGFIYFATDKGIDRLDVEAEKIKHFTTDQGVPRGEFKVAHNDNRGNLWFGMGNGLLRYKPQADVPTELSKILITALEIEGKPQAISAVGTEEIALSDLSPEQNQVRVSFTNISTTQDPNLLFQYKFENQDNWSMPFKERFVNFANLSSGDYKISLRAINADGAVSPNTAKIFFTILRPIYLRWWFLTLAALLIGFIVWQFYRVRVRRLLEIERTRTRIATDLHDDIGSDLSKISLLSEVVKMQMKSGNDDSNRLLTTIAETSRKSVDSMRDIVWAINPSRDSLNDLVKKMRQFAEETLVEKNIKLTFNAPSDNQKLKLSMDTRRELYMIFKEAVSNAAKYSNCSEVKIDFEILGKEISLNIKDNGKGFDISEDFEGNGLKNMKLRCETLKGKFGINSHKNIGTKISAKFPQV